MDIQLEFYKIQADNSRHLEVQRSTIAGIATAVSGVICGELLKKSPLSRNDLMYTVTLTAVGLIALLFSAKLYERTRYRNELIRLVEKKLDPTLAAFSVEAKKTMRRKHRFLFWLRLNWIWNSLFAGIAILGFSLTLKILYL